MTVPPDEGRDPNPPGDDTSAAEQPLDFDPYRFGKPDHPIPPEYAPPGYVPPAAPAPGPLWPPTEDDARGRPSGGYQGYQGGYPGGGYPGHSRYPGQYPPPPPGYHAYGAVPASTGKATTAMVLGILAIIFFWLTVLDLALAIPAIVLGALAVRDANRHPQRPGHGKALAGLICGIISVVLIIATVAVVYTRLKPCLKYGLSSDAYNSCVSNRI